MFNRKRIKNLEEQINGKPKRHLSFVGVTLEGTAGIISNHKALCDYVSLLELEHYKLKSIVNELVDYVYGEK